MSLFAAWIDGGECLIGLLMARLGGRNGRFSITLFTILLLLLHIIVHFYPITIQKLQKKSRPVGRLG